MGGFQFHVKLTSVKIKLSRDGVMLLNNFMLLG